MSLRPICSADHEMEMRSLHRAPKTVAIVAMGRSCDQYIHHCTNLGGRRAMADETWAIGHQGGVIQCDRVFMMNDIRASIEQGERLKLPHVRVALGWLKTHPGPVYVSKALPDYPGTVDYPLDDVVRHLKFGYFNGSVAYAVGLAFLLLDQLRDRPPFPVLLDMQDRLVHAQLVDRGVLGDELQELVAEADVVNRYDRAPLYIDRNAFELKTAEETAAQAVDHDFAVEVLAGLGDDIGAQPIFEPRRLRHDHRCCRGSNKENQDDQQDTEQASHSVHASAHAKSKPIILQKTRRNAETAEFAENQPEIGSAISACSAFPLRDSLEGLPDAKVQAPASRFRSTIHLEAWDWVELVAEVEPNRTHRRLIAKT